MGKKIMILSIMTFCVMPMFAHTINYSLDKMGGGEVFFTYLLEGYKHIIPFGLDHILFIMCVCFLNTNLRQILLQATMFTVAHTVTLGLAMYGRITPPANIVEPIIALSIVFLALENLFSTQVKPWRLVMIFLFGLIHGMGFAGALSELGMPDYAFATALLSFNLGVEFGQVSVILVFYFLISKPFRDTRWYRKKLVNPLSLTIALVAGYWTLERIFSA